MDSPPFPPPATAAIVGAGEPPHSHSLPPLPTSKLRLMCSYGGHIVPRPHTKSLCYAGGETRIVAVDRRTTASAIAALTHHLSRTLYGNRPFTLKYQLPNEELDSLISVTTDEDLQNMLEEHDRIASSPTPSRIRLFLFPTRPESVGSLLLDPKSESWFSDALKSTMIINRGLSDGSGMGNGLMGLDSSEGNDESLMNSGDSGKCGGGGDSGSVPESMVLETCSSFGSINSSISASNLLPVGVNNEDSGSNLVEKKVKLAAPGSIESDNSTPSAVTDQKLRIYQDQMLPEPESIIYNPSATIQMPKPHQVSGYPIPNIPDQRQHPVQYFQAGSPQFLPYPPGPLPVSSYYPMYVPNQPYPIYVMPVGPTDQSYNTPTPPDVNGSLTRPPLHTHIASSRATYKEIMVSQPASEAVAPEAACLGSAQPVSPHSMVNPSYENDYDNDLVYAQIYKSQPSAPVFSVPKYKTVTKAAVVQIGNSQQ